jgi:hypothetical protein
MPNPLIIKNLYVPKVGEGVPMLEALREAADVWETAGFPRLQLWKPYDGPHNSVVTIQRWNSFAEWEGLRDRFSKINELRSVVFERIYPTNAAAYDTELYEEL